MTERDYGVGFLVSSPLITAGGQDFLTSPTIAAGDAQIRDVDGLYANLAAEWRAFTSGSAKPVEGETITGATSTETGVVIGTVLTSGSWAGADGAGQIAAEQLSGAFQSEDLNGSQAGANFATIGGDFDGGGLFVEGDNFDMWFAVTSAQAQVGLGFGNIRVKDQTATEEWEDVDLPFTTRGHPDADNPEGTIDAGTLDAAPASGYIELPADKSALAVKGAVAIITRSDVTADVGNIFRAFEEGTIASAGTLYDSDNDRLKGRWNRVPTGAAAEMRYNLYADIPLALIIQEEADEAIADFDLQGEFDTFFGVVSGAVATDAGNSGTGFEVDTTVGTDVRTGLLRLTSGALSGETKLVSWTGTTVTVISQTDMPTSLKQFSATPADAVTFKFIPSA